ncbi:MAG TPA: DUF5009 domain-containing protein [Acidobacteriota bacterium]|nr:DUF5009 domain-containing protein [Acidobacteriota bacterium]
MGNLWDGQPDVEPRLLSLDVFRGIVMFCLIAEATGIYDLMALPAQGTIINTIALQFRHHPWNGLRLWDLGQPFFMFISGAAMSLSYTRRWQAGTAWKRTLVQALRRALILFALGWGIYLIAPAEDGPRMAFLYDVLPQLAVAGLFGFVILRLSARIRFIISLGLIAVTESLYRVWGLVSHGRPFAAGDNFGASVDRLILGNVSPENWVAFNVVPLTALVIWGSLAGRWLKGDPFRVRQVWNLSYWGLGGLAAGLALSLYTPIIRRIATSSFVLISGGAGLLALALAGWLVDIAKVGRRANIFRAIGVNSIFIYLFAQIGGAGWLRRLIVPFAGVVVGGSTSYSAELVAALVTQALMCGLCYDLFRRKIRIRI